MTEGARASLDDLFTRGRREDRAVLLPYLTAGLPSLGESVAMFESMAEGGADGFEVGIPYSDPLMDGPVIHEAGLRALEGGANVDKSLQLVASVVERTALPTIVMTYVNPVLRRGADSFAAEVAHAGASAVILADLPAEESGPFRAAFGKRGLGTVLFAAPTADDERLRTIAGMDPVFVYGIAEMGVTGERDSGSGRAAELAARVRATTQAPLVLGVGISTPQQARSAAAVADGVIVGSALVRRVLEASSSQDAADRLRVAVADLAVAVRRVD